MILSLNNFFKFFIFSFPATLIIGPVGYEFVILVFSIYFLLKYRQFLFLDIIVIILFIYFIYILILSIFSKNIILSLESSLFFFRFIFFSLVISFAFENFKNLNKIFSIILCILFLLLIFDAFFQFFLGFNFIGFVMDPIRGYGRISGIFGEEYVLGSYLSRLSPLLIGLLIYNFKNKKNFYIFISFLIIIINATIFISGERSALLYCIIFNLLILIMDRKRFIVNLISIFLSFIICFGIINISKPHKERIIDKSIYQITNTENQMTRLDSLVRDSKFDISKLKIFSKTHQDHYQKAIKIFNNNKLFGIGPKLFRQECSNKIYTQKKFHNNVKMLKKGCSTHPHNIYIQSLAETGIFGFFFLFLFLAYISIKILVQILLQTNHFIFSYIYIAMFISLFPIVPTGSLFNSWLLSINFFIYGYFFYIKRNRLKLIG